MEKVPARRPESRKGKGKRRENRGAATAEDAVTGPDRCPATTAATAINVDAANDCHDAATAAAISGPVFQIKLRKLKFQSVQ